LNGHSLIYFTLHVFAQPRLGNIFHKVIANQEMSWSEPRNLRIFVILPCLSWNVFRTIDSLIFPTTMKVFDIQDVDAHSCMVRKQLFLNIETLIMTFRGLQC
jgi:hypothetical protein